MLKTTTLLLFFIALIGNTLLAQRGKHGSYTVIAANTQLNSYTAVTANAAVNATSITVASNTLTNAVLTTNLAAGDLIMIIQMQGATMDIDPIPATPVALGGWGGTYTVPIGHQGDWGTTQDLWGQVTSYNNAGKYELVEVRSVSGGTTINLMCGLVNAYTASGHVQVVRVPRFTNLTINAGMSIVPALWDGTIGGVVSLEVNGILTLNATSKVLATGYGFRGGVCDLQTAGSPPGSATNVGYCASSAAIEGAEKGEGIGGFYTEYDALYSRYCKSAPANAGGGGGNHNAGGGGGANIGTGAYTGKGIPVAGYTTAWDLESASFSTSTSSGGGRGGYSYSTNNQVETSVGPNIALWSGDYRRTEGGLGGHPLTYSASRIFMGGGGGAGDANTNPTQGGAGGRGGGIVFLTVYGSITGTGTIESNGAVGQNANPLGQVAPGASATKYGNDGAGGAGGGGAIAISNGTAIPATVTLSATGGAGGNQVISFGTFSSPAMEADGPGGGGAGGMVAFTSGTPVQTVAGGVNGTTNSSHVNLFPPNGATMGAAGTASLPQPFFDITSPNVTICPNTSTTLTATVIGALPGGSLTWYSTQFGATVLGTGTTFTTPVLAATTTYYIGTCPGTFRVPVVVTVGGGATISGTLTIPVGGTTLLTGSGTPNGSTPWTSSATGIGTVTSGGLVTGISVGSTTITYMNSSGCLVTAVVIVTAPLPVELLYFTASLNDRKTVDLVWATASEINNAYFSVQRSEDLQSWMEVVIQEGVGNSNKTLYYEGEDAHPLIGNNYYQLKQVDFDGSVKLSEIETVYYSNNSEVLVYPNPANSIIHLVGKGIDETNLALFDSQGKMIEFSPSVVSSDHIAVSTQHLANGIYYFQLMNNGVVEMVKMNVFHN